jgi:hypothetical protein
VLILIEASFLVSSGCYAIMDHSRLCSCCWCTLPPLHTMITFRKLMSIVLTMGSASLSSTS